MDEELKKLLEAGNYDAYYKALYQRMDNYLSPEASARRADESNRLYNEKLALVRQYSEDPAFAPLDLAQYLRTTGADLLTGYRKAGEAWKIHQYDPELFRRITNDKSLLGEDADLKDLSEISDDDLLRLYNVIGAYAKAGVEDDWVNEALYDTNINYDTYLNDLFREKDIVYNVYGEEFANAGGNPNDAKAFTNYLRDKHRDLYDKFYYGHSKEDYDANGNLIPLGGAAPEPKSNSSLSVAASEPKRDPRLERQARRLSNDYLRNSSKQLDRDIAAETAADENEFFKNLGSEQFTLPLDSTPLNAFPNGVPTYQAAPAKPAEPTPQKQQAVRPTPIAPLSVLLKMPEATTTIGAGIDRKPTQSGAISYTFDLEDNDIADPSPKISSPQNISGSEATQVSNRQSFTPLPSLGALKMPGAVQQNTEDPLSGVKLKPISPTTPMSESDMWSALGDPLATYGQGMFGPSTLDQYRNAQAGLDALKGLNVDDAARKSAESMLNSQKLQAGVGMGLSVLQGATGLMNSFNSLNTIADTSAQQGKVNDINAIGTRNYGNYNDLASGYDALNRQANFDYDDIRGMNTMQKVGNVASAIGTGASAGSAFGPWGAVAGGLVGLGTGIAGWASGDVKARNEQARLQREARQATNSAVTNLNAANESMTNRQFRSGITTRAAQGGQIERQQMSIKEFADKVLKVRKANDVNRSMNIVRRKGEGGTIIKIKM